MGIPSETNVGSYIFIHVVMLFLFNRVSLRVLSKIQHTLYMDFFFLYIADKNLAITWSFKSDILTLREELFAICFEQKLSSCQW